MNEPSDMERSRLLLGWLAARRAVDHCLSDLLAAGPAGERRVRESLARVDDLETRAQVAFDRYRSAAESVEGTDPGARRPPAWIVESPGPGTPEDSQDSRTNDVGRSRSERSAAADRAGATPPDSRPFDVDTRNVRPLPRSSRMVPAGREQAGPEPAPGSERWAPRDRPRLNIVRETDLARSSSNTKSNQRHR